MGIRTVRPDTGAWKMYACAVWVGVFSFVLLMLGEWRGALIGFALAGDIAAHPYLRRGWYLIGYADGRADSARVNRLLEEP